MSDHAHKDPNGPGQGVLDIEFLKEWDRAEVSDGEAGSLGSPVGSGDEMPEADSEQPELELDLHEEIAKFKEIREGMYRVQPSEGYAQLLEEKALRKLSERQALLRTSMQADSRIPTSAERIVRGAVDEFRDTLDFLVDAELRLSSDNVPDALAAKSRVVKALIAERLAAEALVSKIQAALQETKTSVHEVAASFRTRDMTTRTLAQITGAMEGVCAAASTLGRLKHGLDNVHSFQHYQTLLGEQAVSTAKALSMLEDSSQCAENDAMAVDTTNELLGSPSIQPSLDAPDSSMDGQQAGPAEQGGQYTVASRTAESLEEALTHALINVDGATENLLCGYRHPNLQEKYIDQARDDAVQAKTALWTAGNALKEMVLRSGLQDVPGWSEVIKTMDEARSDVSLTSCAPYTSIASRIIAELQELPFVKAEDSDAERDVVMSGE